MPGTLVVLAPSREVGGCMDVYRSVLFVILLLEVWWWRVLLAASTILVACHDRCVVRLLVWDFWSEGRSIV